jgi:N-acetylglucosamine-6-phosphate deacetylase
MTVRPVMTVSGSRVITPDGVIDNGVIEMADGLIRSVSGRDTSTVRADVEARLDGGWVVPGFIDLHMHGGGGHDVTRSPDAMARAVAFHRSHGTTRTLVSLMAQPVDVTCAQLDWIADLTRRGDVLGAHLEGPFLSAAQCGAQRPENLQAPDRLVLQKLLQAGQGSVRTVTVAPEPAGALEVIADLVDAGVVAAIGHTAASYEQAMAAITAGASLATHVFNAMGRFEQRAPGAAGAALDAGIYLEVIADGTHLHDALVRLITRTAPGRTAFITDAISAAGASDGMYTLGDQSVLVTDGQARLPNADSLAGSTVTMGDTFRRVVRSVGLSIADAVEATSATPARVLGVDDRFGSIAPGRAADLVVLDDDLHVQRVMTGGRWLDHG